MSSVADEEVVAAAAGRVLRDMDWSSVDIPNGLLETAWWSRMTAAAGATGATIVYPEQQLPYVEFGGNDWDGFLASRSRNFRKGLWRMQRRLAEAGAVEFRLTDAEHLEADMRTLFDLHERRWGRGSIFLTTQSRRFHERFAEAALERGWLRLGVLELDGSAIAATYGWRIGDRFSEYQRGYETSLARFGPGKLVMAEMMRTLNEEGATVFDQLLGGEAYKLQIADGVRLVRSARSALPWRPAGAAIDAERLARRAWGRVPAGAKRLARARRSGEAR